MAFRLVPRSTVIADKGIVIISAPNIALSRHNRYFIFEKEFRPPISCTWMAIYSEQAYTYTGHIQMERWAILLYFVVFKRFSRSKLNLFLTPLPSRIIIIMSGLSLKRSEKFVFGIIGTCRWKPAIMDGAWKAPLNLKWNILFLPFWRAHRAPKMFADQLWPQ